jgi:tRNA-2-methylthio-N6-dimethylallyladenosine synthase
MRGCDRFCTFCIVPYTRGREKSLPPEEILRQVRLASEQGFREVCLLGQTVNSYRYESVDFSDLLRMVGGVEGVERIRFMSPHPVGFSPALIAAIAEVPQISPHMHLPVQSGSNSVLARMRRDYTIEEYLAVLTKLRAAVPGIAVSTDVIVGFCGETEEDYRKTFDLMEASRFDFAFMFVYSPRVGTVAARSLEDDVPEETKKRRIAGIVALFAEFIGRTVKVLFEGPSKKRKTQSFGRTPDFKSVVVDGEYAKGIIADVAVTEANAHTLFGKVVS